MNRSEAGYVVLVNISVKHEYQEMFQEAILGNAGQSLASELDCWVFDVAVNTQGNEFWLYEVYRDQQAFESHLKTEHFLEFDRLTQTWLEAKSIQTFWRLKGQ
jgi:autoinducer 2-degrading protein